MENCESIPLELLKFWLLQAEQNEFDAVVKLSELFGSIDEAQKFLNQQQEK